MADENMLIKDKKKLDLRCEKFNEFLNDAEGNWEIYKTSTKRWLFRLKLCVSSAENLIEEYNYEYIQAKQDTTTTSASTSTSFLHHISQNIKEMNKKFDELLERRREDVELIDKEGESKAQIHSRPPSSPHSDQTMIYGRDIDQKMIVEMLTNSNQQNYEQDSIASIISLVGMGGLGKTTLARSVYKDDKICQYFKTKAWVCVSDEFVVERITKDALVSVTEKPCNLTVFSVIQEKLQAELKGKRFLLVLDDMWNEIQEFSHMLGFLQTLGSPGSKILVTTRSKVVAETMNPSLDYNLRALHFNDGWKLFSSRAFCGSTVDHDNQVLLEDIGKKIVEKCKGLPLIIKVFGDNLRDKNGDVESWKEILERNPLEMKSENGENEILECLRLSYTNLPLELKRCFLYCSVYPKDHLFLRDELIRLWIAQGILRDEPLNEYVNGLLHRSFLEKHEQCEDWSESKYTLHDLMHDLAQQILKEEHSLLPADELPAEDKRSSRFEPIHGRSFHQSLYPPPKEIKIECLHMHLKHLRVLIWADDALTCLPDSIAELKHLRYLRLDTPNLECLPESVCQLYNLRTLHCDWLEELPSNIRKLRMLRHIICVNHLCIPVGLGELIHLQTLPKLLVTSEDEEYGGIEELLNLSMLRGLLTLNQLKNEYINNEDKTVKLYEKPHLQQLQLIWNDFGEEETSTIDVLNNLRPHLNLVKLQISFYCGVVFPDWLGCSTFSNLTHVTLNHCFRCETLPPMGQLVSLKELNIFELTKLERIGVEFYGGGNQMVAFRSLEKMVFNNLRRWKEWCGVDECSFPSLCELEIWECNRLHLSNVPQMFSKLQNLTVGDSSHVIDLCKTHVTTHLSAIKKLRLDDKR